MAHEGFERPVSHADAVAIGTAHDVDWSVYNKHQFHQGLNVELEHSRTVGGDLATVVEIVIDHLEEDSHYYTKLGKAGL